LRCLNMTISAHIINNCVFGEGAVLSALEELLRWDPCRTNCDEHQLISLSAVPGCHVSFGRRCCLHGSRLLGKAPLANPMHWLACLNDVHHHAGRGRGGVIPEDHPASGAGIVKKE
jgi:hypothetical protein